MRRTANWITLAVPPPLQQGDVHLWRILVPGAERLPPYWLDLLTAEEKERAARKRIPLDARRTVASRACLRLLLGRYLDVPPSSIAFATTAHGKPQLAAPPTAPQFELNVSHSGNWVVIGFARGLPLGVDVECHRELEFSELVNSFFSPQEREAWSRVPASEPASAFFSAWTRKESYLKALGLGLSKSLDSFSVEFGPDPSSDLVSDASDPSTPQHWRIASVDLASGYSCAVAIGSSARALHTFTFDFEPPPGRARGKTAPGFADAAT